jgi:hypothetical protein
MLEQYENTHEVDFSHCFDVSASTLSLHSTKTLHKNHLLNTIRYYTKECQERPIDNEFINTYSEITCFTLDGLLSPDECKNLIQAAEESGFKDLERGYRKGYRDNQRVVLYDEISATILFDRVKGYLPRRIVELSSDTEWELGYLNPMIRFGKYNPNDAFAAHKDSGFSDVKNKRDSKAMLTIMFYLNSVVSLSSKQGGRTRMLTLNKTCRKSEDDKCEVLDAIEPAAGKCIIFNQYCIYHDGESVGDCEEPKYIMRTDIMFYKRT